MLHNVQNFIIIRISDFCSVHVHTPRHFRPRSWSRRPLLGVCSIFSIITLAKPTRAAPMPCRWRRWNRKRSVVCLLCIFPFYYSFSVNGVWISLCVCTVCFADPKRACSLPNAYTPLSYQHFLLKNSILLYSWCASQVTWKQTRKHWIWWFHPSSSKIWNIWRDWWTARKTWSLTKNTSRCVLFFFF